MNQEQINEKLSASAPAKDWIEDFVKSDDPRFAGKSKDERIMMALGAYYAAQKNESVELEENAGYIETLHTKYKFLRRQADEAEEKYKKAKERNLDDDSLETYYTAVRTLNDRADDVYDAYVDARDKAKKNESVEQIQENMGTATITKTGHRLNGKTGRIFHKFEDGRINVQLTNSTRKGDVTNLTLHPGQYRLNADQKNESVELEEAVDFRTMKDDSLKQWLKRNDTDDSVSAVAGAQILAAKKEVKRRGIQLKSEGSVSLNYDREGGIPVTEVKSTDCGLDDLETAIADQEAKKKKEKAEGEGTCKTEALDPVGKEDDDVDNDGDSDESDEYLKNRRKAVTKAIQNEELEEGVEEIKARVAKYKVGDKTNFGIIKAISGTAIEFKSKDLPVTKIAFNQRKMGSKDFVLDRLSRMNESFTEARDLKIAQLALKSDGSGKLEDFVKNYSVVGKSILQIKEEYATFLKANKKQEEEGIQNYP